MIHYFLLATVILIVHADSTLNCDYGSECCWQSANHSDIWAKHSASSSDKEFFRRAFLSSSQPPRGSYLLHRSKVKTSSYVSCPFCSKNGHVSVNMRHWQNANTHLSLCWQHEGDASPESEHCQDAKHIKQGRVSHYNFKVPQGKSVRLLLLAENAEPDSYSTVVIEKIEVIVKTCHDDESSGEDITRTKKRESKLLHHADLLKRQMTEPRARSRSYMGNAAETVKLPTSESTANSRIVLKKVNTLQVTVPTTVLPTTTEAAKQATPSGNPLVDLLGDKLVSFLDPNYVTSDDDENNIEDYTDDLESTTMAATTATIHSITRKEVASKTKSSLSRQLGPYLAREVTAAPQQENSKLIERESPLSITAFLTAGKPMKTVPQDEIQLVQPSQPLPLGGPQPCSTNGGCLFEKNFCDWRTPFGMDHKFYLTEVHLSRFAQAVVPSGGTAVIETRTSMTEPHMVLFDGLEFSLGTRLIGCCVMSDRSVCPFTTSADQGPILWQFSKFQCPAKTTSIAFLCENYGVTSGVCAVDNIRIHRTDDVFFLEPCQKRTLSQA